MDRRLPLFFAALTTLAACKKDPAPPTPAREQPAPLEKAAPPEAAKTITATRAQLEAAYLADCAYTQTIDVEAPETESGTRKGDECVARDFEQNCAPDVYGCWDKLERCRDACGKPCSDCQVACTSSCKDCKTACASKPDRDACAKACASGRADCRKRCVDALAACRGARCRGEEESCMKEGEAMRAKACGDGCAGLRKCIEATWSEGGNEADCIKKFPTLSEKCRDWCRPGE